MDDRDHGDAMVVIAIVVSRVEALVLVSSLEAAGILAVAGGVHHASVEVISLALGGHRISVPASQWQEASTILRELGADREWQFCEGLRRAVLRFLALWVALYGATMALAVAMGSLPAWSLAAVPFAALTVPVNPQGRGDFYLAPEAA
jgi:hypothetical protein